MERRSYFISGTYFARKIDYYLSEKAEKKGDLFLIQMKQGIQLGNKSVKGDGYISSQNHPCPIFGVHNITIDEILDDCLVNSLF